MDRYTKYLAENVLSEDKVVTYRYLSRALRVHVNTAKQMLFEFHRSQNAKCPNTVHATYLVYGRKKGHAQQPSALKNGDSDIEMTSSAPEAESISEAVPAYSLSLIPEDRLNDALADYDEVSSIHVYSIGPHPNKDVALLADAACATLSLESEGDETQLKAITNPRARRRERQGAGLRAAAAAAAAAGAAAVTVTSQAKPIFPKPPTAPSASQVKEALKTSQAVEKNADKASSSAPAKKGSSAPKRAASSGGIMQAFSKAAAASKAKKETPASKPATPASVEESNPQPLSDDGEDDEDMPQPKPSRSSAVKTKKQREEELRRMMESDDEEEKEEEESEYEEPPAEEEPMAEEPKAPEPAKEEPVEIITATTNGRRRGKRKVLRKKQIMDEQGYLVTVTEPAWESFSEDEPPPPSKPKETSSVPTTQASKPKKGGKGGQGSIMSWFAKK